MKLIFSVLIISFLVLAPLQSQAQDKGDIRASASLVGVRFDEALGFSLGGEYFLTNRLSTAANLLYVEESLFFSVKESLLGADLRYYFVKKRLNVYALSGYGYYRRRTEAPTAEVTRRYNSVSLGGGVQYGISDRWSVEFNAKTWYNSDGFYRVFGLGAAFTLN